MSSQREASKKEWKSNDTIEDLNSGSLQRIADATETMAKGFSGILQRLIAERDSALESKEYFRQMYNETEKSNRCLKANNTKLRNRLKALIAK